MRNDAQRKGKPFHQADKEERLRVNVTQRLEELRNFNVERASLDEMLLVERDLDGLRASYERRAVPTPEWLADQISTLNTEITRRTKDDLERRLKELDAQEAGLMSATEKRERLAKEREAIRARLKMDVPQGT